MISDKVEKTMLSGGMLPARSILVGLSGGADSTALLYILHGLSKKYGFTLYAAHINHCLRKGTADRDESFSRELCERLGVEFFCCKADVGAEAKRLGISEELAGRRIRYEFFDKLSKKKSITYIATAHHKNDNAETITMNFIRGSGIRGLCGIPRRRGNIIRPLLDITRSEIEEYCAERGIGYVTDETNAEIVYTRNKIRNILIPEIEREFNPSVVDTVTKNAEIMAADEDYLSICADKAYSEITDGGAADISLLKSSHRAIALRVIRKMIDDVCGISDISSFVIGSVYELALMGRTGAKCDITRGVYAVVRYGRLIIEREAEPCGDFEYNIAIGQKLYIPELGFSVLAQSASGSMSDDAQYFSLPDGSSRIAIRNRRSGDRFCPWGMSGTKTVKAFMIDEKIPAPMRDRTGIVTIDGDIAWIIGHRRDRRFKFNGSGIKISILY